MNVVSRRHVLSVGSVVGLAGATPSLCLAGAPRVMSSVQVPPDRYPAHDAPLVQEVVGKSHFDAETVEKLVAARPELAKASWDWGFGDWETAIGAASHVGRPDIVELLMANGARPTLFTFAMLGQVDVVRAIVEANPGIQRIHGPHGITLMSHARAGEAAAESVVAYLEEIGGADEGHTSLPLDEELRDMYLGTYEYGPSDEQKFIVRTGRNGQLSLQVGNGVSRQLFHLGDHTFHPAGAPSVKVVFDIQARAVIRVRVIDGDRTVRARPW